MRRWFLGAVCAASFYAGPALADDAVTVGLAIPMTVTDGSVYVAAEHEGFFREAHLAVRFVVFQGAGIVIPQVAAKQVTIGLPMAEPVLASYQPGNAPVPVEFFYNDSPYNSIELAVLADGPIRRIADLKGKAIGVGAMSWGTIPQTRALLRDAGLQPGKDADIVAVGILGSGFNALRTGQVAALNYNHEWNEMLARQGTPIRRLAYPPVFANMIGNGFLAHRDVVRDQPDLLTRFGRAITEARIFCEEAPGVCVHDFWKAQPQAKPKDRPEAAAYAEAVALLHDRLVPTLSRADGSERRHGAFVLADIKAYVGAMQKAGEFATADLPYDQLFTNRLVDGFNAFDEAALRGRAKAAAAPQ